MEGFWKLPGPGLFLERLAAAAAGGRHVVLPLPLLHPPGLEAALRDRLGPAWDFGEVRLPGGERPEALLAGCLGLPARSTAREIAASERLAGRALWISGVDAEALEDWHGLLREFAATTQNLPTSERGVLVLSQVGLPPDAAPREDVCLAVLRWEGCVSGLDMLLFSALLLRGRDASPVRTQLLATMIARLALWDPLLACRLTGEDPERLFAPEEILREYAAERGWDGPNPSCWRDGSRDLFDGESQVHSAHPESRNGTGLIESRLRQAQIAALLPHVEERRRLLLPRLRRWIVPGLPHESDGCVFESVESLELRHLHTIADAHHAPPEIMRELRLLRGLRNDLAHMELLDAARALDPNLYSR